jgi:hypothetical protein
MGNDPLRNIGLVALALVLLPSLLWSYLTVRRLKYEEF